MEVICVQCSKLFTINKYANKEKTKCCSRSCKDKNYAIVHKDIKALWRKNNPDKIKRMRRKTSLKNKYNITIDNYNSMFITQEGRCNICNIHQSKLNKILCVDHCHKTGKVRGLLCEGCNFAIGIFKDDINILSNAIEYLKEHNENL